MPAYVACYKGREVYGSTSVIEDNSDDVCRRICKKVVIEAGEENSRSDPDRIVKVDVGELYLRRSDKVACRKFYKTFDVVPPLKKLTPSEYEEEWKEVLKDTPVEFHEFVRMLSNGSIELSRGIDHDKIIAYGKVMVRELNEAIDKYKENLW